MKNKDLFEAIMSVKDLGTLGPGELLSYTQFLRAISASPSGPFGIGMFNGSDLYRLNQHVVDLYGVYSKKLPGASQFIHTNPHPDTPLPPNKKSPALVRDTLHLADAMNYSKKCHKSAEEWAETLPFSLRRITKAMLRKIAYVDAAGEISLLAYHFQESLQRDGEQVIKPLAPTFGVANILTWVAYTLYDNVADDNPDTPGIYIAAANLCARKARQLYRALSPYSLLPERLFNESDEAIGIEVSLRGHARQLHVHRHKQLLSAKSIAHCIGPLLIVEKELPVAVSSAERGLRLYCAARQLNDDLHDWQDDYNKGQHQYVTARIQQDLRKASTSLQGNTEDMRMIFWQKTLDDLLHEQERMLRRARQLLTRGSLKAHSSFVELTLAPIQQSLNEARRQNKFEKEFMVHFAVNHELSEGTAPVSSHKHQ